jgi:hypothetical protein
MQTEKCSVRIVTHKRVVRRQHWVLGRSKGQFIVLEIPVESPNKITYETLYSRQERLSTRQPLLVLSTNFIQNIQVQGVRTLHLQLERVQFLVSHGTLRMGVNYQRPPIQLVGRVLTLGGHGLKQMDVLYPPRRPHQLLERVLTLGGHGIKQMDVPYLLRQLIQQLERVPIQVLHGERQQA